MGNTDRLLTRPQFGCEARRLRPSQPVLIALPSVSSVLRCALFRRAGTGVQSMGGHESLESAAEEATA